MALGKLAASAAAASLMLSPVAAQAATRASAAQPVAVKTGERRSAPVKAEQNLAGASWLLILAGVVGVAATAAVVAKASRGA